jgi:hypothetical protein
MTHRNALENCLVRRMALLSLDTELEANANFWQQPSFYSSNKAGSEKGLIFVWYAACKGKN